MDCSSDGPAPGPIDRPVDETAAPSPLARALAFGAVMIAGVCGALIGFAFVDLQCQDCGAATSAGALVGAILGAGGTGIVAVLAMRAMGEWSGDGRRLPPADTESKRWGGDVPLDDRL